MVETATIIAGLKRPVPGDLVVHAENRLVLAIRFHARRDRLPWTKIDVFNQRNAGLGVHQRWWGSGAGGEVGLCVGGAVRASAALLEDQIDIGGAEPAARV